jgi:hypothetical protein
MAQKKLRTITNWEAKRSGASLTVIGVDEEDGAVVKLTEITRIWWSKTTSCVHAQQKGGGEVYLAT